jgi:hypothetical protein
VPQLRLVSIAYPRSRRGGGGRRDRYTYVHGAATILLNTVGIGLFCWLIFTLAVCALPFFVAVNAGMMAFHGGAGILGAPLVGIAAGAVTLAIGQTRLRSHTVSDPAGANCGRVRRPSRLCGLPRHTRPVADLRAFARLARGFCLPRRHLHRRCGVDTLDCLHGARPPGPSRVMGHTSQPVVTAVARD